MAPTNYNNVFNRTDYRPLWRQLESVAEMTGKTINRKVTKQKKVKVNWAGYTKEEWVEVLKAENGEENKLDELQKDMFPLSKVMEFDEETMDMYKRAINKALYKK